MYYIYATTMLACGLQHVLLLLGVEAFGLLVIK